jgi:molybdopterin molybdotransferase
VTSGATPDAAAGGSDLSTVEAYQAAILSAITPLAPTSLELAAAEGCVLAEDVTAAVALPSFDNSSMDGYAVHAADVASAADDSPATLRVTGEIAAGDIGEHRLAPGTAIRIMTGARLPDGADAVIPVEWTNDDDAQVAIYRPAERGNAVRYAGGDAAQGETLLTAGTRMRPMQIAVAASAGRQAVTVRPRPRVVVLSTGDELTEPGTPLVPGRIWDSNSYMIAAAAREAGAVASRRAGVPDDPAGVLPALEEQLAHADLLITTGGVSMGGEHDVVKAALRKLGTVTFRKVAMQPGMPQGIGRVAGATIVTLPGNPVSALVSFEVFIRPALRKAMGLPDPDRPHRPAVLAETLTSPRGKRQFRRAILDHETGSVVSYGPPASHHLRWLASANGLLDIPEDVVEVSAGTQLQVWDLS